MSESPAPESSGVSARLQEFGRFLGGMVLPNIPAFLGWGLLAALFLPSGWLPNAHFARLIGPIITYLLPTLIAYTGGRAVHGQRGAVVASVAVLGAIVGSNVPMFLGAMIIGPFTALLLKKIDALTDGRVTETLKYLVDTVIAGVLGAALAVAGLLLVGPAISSVTTTAGQGITFLLHHHALPAVSVIIEPLRVLFLNNAVNHGILAPLGVVDAAHHGKSIVFMLEADPGPGLGVLLACLAFGPRTLRRTLPAAIVIEFLGGIAEIYFPYVLMRPRLVLGAIAGAASGIAVFQATGVGLLATPTPGSIFAFLAVTPRTDYPGVITGVVVATAVSFLVSSALFGFGLKRATEPAAATSP